MTVKKTLHELAKEFPNKTYRELEQYRNADRQEEAIEIGHNQPPDLVEVMAVENEKLKKRAQEAEGELSILKGIETNRVKEAQARCDHLQDELGEVKKNNNELYNRIAELIEANEKEVKNLKWIKDHDYIFLVDENKKLHKENNELRLDNKRLASEVEDWIDKMRKSGL